MADSGYLVPPSQDPSKEHIWWETKKRLDRFLPDLFKEIFPEPPSEKPLPTSETTSPVLPSHNNAASAAEETPDENGPPAPSQPESDSSEAEAETKTKAEAGSPNPEQASP